MDHGLATGVALSSFIPASHSFPSPSTPPFTTTTILASSPSHFFVLPYRVFRVYAPTMLLNPVAIVALVLYLIVGQLTVPQRLQARFKSLGHRVHQKISSALSLPHATFEPQDYPVIFEDNPVEALPIAPVKTSVIYPPEAIPTPAVPLEDYVEVATQEVCPMRCDDHSLSASARVFVVPSENRGPFGWQDLFNYRVLEVLAAICFSVCLVVFPFVVRRIPRSETLDETEWPIDTPPKLLPPKFLAPPTTARIQILDSKTYAPLEPISSPAPSEPSVLRLAREYPPVSPDTRRDLSI